MCRTYFNKLCYDQYDYKIQKIYKSSIEQFYCYGSSNLFHQCMLPVQLDVSFLMCVYMCDLSNRHEKVQEQFIRSVCITKKKDNEKYGGDGVRKTYEMCLCLLLQITCFVCLLKYSSILCVMHLVCLTYFGALNLLNL